MFSRAVPRRCGFRIREYETAAAGEPGDGDRERDYVRYAIDGEYPQSLEELAARYGLTYDTSRFFVDYRVNGANLYPDVTIIERGEGS